MKNKNLLKIIKCFIPLSGIIVYLKFIFPIIFIILVNIFFISSIFPGLRSSFLNDTGSVVRQILGLNKTATWLSTDGKNIIDESGERVLLRGVNVAGVNWGGDTQKWNPKATSYVINSWGANIIRTRIIQEDYLRDPKGILDALEKQIIRPARQQGAYVLIHPYITTLNQLPDEGTYKMWLDIADKYRDDPTVLYDLMLEPHDTTHEEIFNAYSELIAQVRQVHPRSLIFVTGGDWGRKINPYLVNPIQYDNIVYRANVYNSVDEFEEIFGLIAQDLPVFIGEFGADAYPRMSQKDVTSLIRYAEQLGIGWAAWSFHDIGCPCLLEDHIKYTPSNYGKLVYTALQGDNVAEVYREINEQAQINLSALPSQYILYDDEFKVNVIQEGWESDTDLESLEMSVEGFKSILINFKETQAGAIFVFPELVSTQSYSNIQFYLYKEDIKQIISLSISDDQHNQSNKVVVSDFLIGGEKGWAIVNIPLSLLNINSDSINKILIEQDAGAADSRIFIDNIILTREQR